MSHDCDTACIKVKLRFSFFFFFMKGFNISEWLNVKHKYLLQFKKKNGGSLYEVFYLYIDIQVSLLFSMVMRSNLNYFKQKSIIQIIFFNFLIKSYMLL